MRKTMKFIHIADVHLGAAPDKTMPWSEERRKEIYESFYRVLTICNEKEIDLLLIAGDLFHHQPLLRELKELNYHFSKLKHTKVVMIAGNHDYIGVRSHYADFPWTENVTLISDENMANVYFEELQTEVYGFSYHTRNRNDAVLDDVTFEKNDRLHLLIAHGGDEKNLPFNKKKLLQSGFDYIALGHIHKPEILSERAAYCGSLEPLDKNEIGDRGYMIGELDESTHKMVSLEFVRLSQRIYIQQEIICDKDTTNGQVMDNMAAFIREHGENNLYRFLLGGVKEEYIEFDTESMMDLGNVVEVIDHVVLDYDFDVLYRENSDNIIGLYINKIRQNEAQTEVSKKALYYGIEALLGARHG